MTWKRKEVITWVTFCVLCFVCFVFCVLCLCFFFFCVCCYLLLFFCFVFLFLFFFCFCFFFFVFVFFFCFCFFFVFVVICCYLLLFFVFVKRKNRNIIGSLSLGQTRRFLLKHKEDKAAKKIEYRLPSGSLILMMGTTQQFWKHSVPKGLTTTKTQKQKQKHKKSGHFSDPYNYFYFYYFFFNNSVCAHIHICSAELKVTEPRINITFRVSWGPNPQLIITCTKTKQQKTKQKHCFTMRQILKFF